MSDRESDSDLEAGDTGNGRRKKTWKRPEVIRASFDDTETGINEGPEILVLLSNS